MTFFSCPKVVSYLKTTWFCPRDICISVFWLMTTGTRLCCMTSICSSQSALGLFRIGGKNKRRKGLCLIAKSKFSKCQYLIGWLDFFLFLFFLLLEGEAFKAQNGLNSQRTCSAVLSAGSNFHKMEHSK